MNDLINIETNDALSLLEEISTSSGFLPYMQLFTLKSGAVADGKINGGEYGLVRDGNITSLSKEVNIVVLTARARAFEQADGEVNVCYDKNDPEYIRIAQAQADKVDGCMAGPEFLLYIPSEKTFATFFCGSATLKREARKLGQFMGGKAANFRSKLITKGQFKWHGPVITACSVELSPMPTLEEVNEQVHRFNNPPKQNKGERVEETLEER